MRFVLDYAGRGGEIGNTTSRWRSRYKVFTDSPVESRIAILLHPDCPKINSVFQDGAYVDPYATCTRVDAQSSDKSRTFWTVEAEWTRDLRNPDPDPRNHPPVIYWESSSASKAATQGYLIDEDGNAGAFGAVTNSATEPFLDPVEDEDDRQVIRVELNLSSFNAAFARQFANRTNEYEWQGFPEHTLLLKPITSQKTYIELPNPSGGEPQRIAYYPTRFEFHYNEETWDHIIPDMGLRAFDGSDLYDMVDKDGNPVTSPVRLDGEGNQMLPSLPYSDTKYRRYRTKKFVDFSLLNLFANGGSLDG